MKYFITGGCGFLGSNIAAQILDNDDELVILDNLSRVGSQQNLSWLQQRGEFQFIHADVRNQNDLEQAIKSVKPDLIYHLAGQVAMTTSIANPRLDFETNLLGSFNLIEAIRHYAPQAFLIYSSTNKVYGDLEQFSYLETESRYICQERPNGFAEDISIEFHSPYGCSKGAAEQYILDYSRIFGLQTVVFRHSSMYGGRQFSTTDQGWLGWFVQKAIETKINSQNVSQGFTISGNGKQVRDLLYITDIVDLYLNASNYSKAITGQVFNIGGGINNSLSILELFQYLEQKLHISLCYNKLPARESDQRFFVADITKASILMNWKPLVSKEIGIKNMIDWICNFNSHETAN